MNIERKAGENRQIVSDLESLPDTMFHPSSLD